MKHKNLKIIGLVFLAGFMVLISCSKEETEEVDPIVGTYTFESATFNETVTITIQDVPVEFNNGDDASAFVGPGLLGSAPCDNEQNAAVDLRENGTAFYVCLNESNQQQMGTWSVNDERTILSIGISYPQPFSLSITDLTITGTSFSGTVSNFPLPLDAGYELGATIPDVGLNYQTASVDITFTKVTP